MTIGERIKQLRQEKNITQEQLAEYLNISYQSVSKWEHGSSSPDISLIVPIAQFFNVTTDELLGHEFAETQEAIDEYAKKVRPLRSQGKWTNCTNLQSRCMKSTRGVNILRRNMLSSCLINPAEQAAASRTMR